MNEEISAWLQQQANWIQEAAVRLIKSGDLTDQDVVEIHDYFRSAAGQRTEAIRDFSALADGAVPTEPLVLASVGNVQGIENLAPAQPLEFSRGNLVVVYGHNGSGKSSYARILKRAAGKPRAQALKPNVFARPPATQSCTLKFLVGNTPTSVEWIANSPGIDALRTIDLFDSDEAQHYLSKESAATYTPRVVSVFEKLAAGVDRVKALVQTEQDGLVSKLPSIPANLATTESARRYTQLAAITSAGEVDKLVAWTPANIDALRLINERLAQSDPAAAAAKKRAEGEQSKRIADRLADAAAKLSPISVRQLQALRIDAAGRRLVAEEAAKLAEGHLDGVGEKTWRSLWEAARAYSARAYQDRAFPVVDDARCVLCQQQLDADAQVRLRSFETYVQGKVQSEADAAESALRSALSILPTRLSAEQISTEIRAAALDPDSWESRLERLWANVEAVSTKVMAGDSGEIGLLEPLEIAELRAVAAGLETQAEQLDRDALQFDRKKANLEKLELEAQHWISQQEQAVRSEVARVARFKDLERLKSQASSRRITIKAAEVAQQVITEAYVARFNEELRALGAKRIEVELTKTRAERGRVLHRLTLRGVQGGVLPDAVLSEGERRIIALAAFLADVCSKPQIAPFVFDDPISSLDHDFEWAVASRLANLAKERQVLIFTHRLSLYGSMDDAAKKVGEDWRKANLVQLCIESYDGDAGHPVAQAAWNARTDKANNILLDRLAKAKKAGEVAGPDAYKALAQGICSDYRKLLERTVEDDLLNEVVKRHRRSVTTDNRLKHLSAITAEDCQFIDDLMSKYSGYEHSQSSDVPIRVPQEGELREDLEGLKSWRAKLAERRRALGN